MEGLSYHCKVILIFLSKEFLIGKGQMEALR